MNIAHWNNKILLLWGLQVVLPCSGIPLRSSEDAEERVFAPPTFPYWGPFGLTGTALFCPWFIGPFGGSWNRACAGPVPPFQPTTTAKAPPAKEESSSTARPPYEDNYNWPNPFPPPKLEIPYNHSFYPLPNGLALMAQRQDQRNNNNNRRGEQRRQQYYQQQHPKPQEYLDDSYKK